MEDRSMVSAVIVDAVRTAGGMRHGALSGWHPVDLAAETLRALVTRNDLDPRLVDDVILGCVTQVGAQSGNLGRLALLAAGWPESVPGTTVDRKCGSSLQAAHFAAQGIMAGAYDVVVAGGVEVMSLVPMGASTMVAAVGKPYGDAITERYAPAGGLVPEGLAAELLARRCCLGRAELDAFAAQSHARAGRAVAQGRFKAEIVAVPTKRRERESGRVVVGRKRLVADEGIRPATTANTLARLLPAYRPDGVITAGNSAQIADGASAVLVMSEERASSLGYTPLARFHSFAVCGVDPITMLSGPIPATRKVLERAKLSLDAIDLVEINEAFAAVVLAWERELRPDMDRVNVSGGAIALGHSLGGSGTRLLTTLCHELARTGGRYGLQTMSAVGGVANATVIERLG
jgi:acetyl-CoA acyltransferase